MGTVTHTQSSSGGSGTPFPAAFSSFSLGESTTSNFSNQSVQRERKDLIQKMAESVVKFCCLNVNFIQSTVAEEKKPQMAFKKNQTTQTPRFPFTEKKKKSVKNGPVLMPKLQADMTEPAHLISLIKSRCTWHTRVESRYFSLAPALTAKLIPSKWAGYKGATEVVKHQAGSTLV